MSDSSKKVAYFNTLIFTIVAGIVSLLLLLALYFDVFKNYMTFIITVEIGIFIIIGICIYQIIKNEADVDKYKRMKNFNIDFTKCPDYFLTKNIDGKIMCSNEYIVEDSYRNKYIMKIYPADDPSKNELYPLPQFHSQGWTNTTLPLDKFPIATFDTATDLKSTSDKCSAVFGQINAYKHYSKIPWTGVSARCESLAK